MQLKTMTAIVAIAGIGLLGDGKSAHAQGQWCAYYEPTIYNCGFATFRQCLETVSGVGGLCSRNYRVQVTPPERTLRRKSKKRRR